MPINKQMRLHDPTDNKEFEKKGTVKTSRNVKQIVNRIVSK